jgi:type II secretory pathway pseudopilin PulG
MKNIKGFTSIELIIVILCLSVLSAMVIVKNPFSISDYSTIASDQLIADIRLVQLKATGTKRSQNIYFDLGKSTYDLREGTTVIERKRLPKDVLIKMAIFSGSNILTFNTLGEPLSNGTITLGNNSDAYVTITVSPITGTVSAS